MITYKGNEKEVEARLSWMYPVLGTLF